MKKCSTVINGTASPARANGSYVMCGQMSKKVSNANDMSLRAQNRDGKNRQGPRECPVSTVYTSNVAPRSHQRRWSADFCKYGTSPAIIVRKNKKEPQPPQRGVSLLRLHTASHSSAKRYSCPAIGVFGSPSHPSSSSSTSSTSSCSSPPPVPTSVITGHDPLGWKLRPKSSSTSPRARAKRLSLQIPLPVVFPDPKSSPAPNSQSDTESTPNPDPSPKTKPPLKPKPFRRHHSDSSAFLRPLPVVTLEDLCAVHLRPLSLSDESDDVFSGGKEEEVKVTPRPRKLSPPVPEKTAMARQIAQLIAHSRRRCLPVGAKNNEENTYTSIVKPKPKHPHLTEQHSSLNVRKTAGLRVDTSCDRERSTPRFPG